MEIKFNDAYLEKLFLNKPVKGKPLYSSEVITKFKKKVLLIQQIENTVKLRSFKSLHFEALKGNKKGLYSIRIDKQYRLEFKIDNNSITLVEIILIEKLSKHYE